MNEVFAFHVDCLEHVVWQNRSQIFQIAIAPELEHIKSQVDEGVIALCVNLFPQKVHEFILSESDFVHISCDVTNLALCPYLIEIHRENACQLLHLFIIRRNVGVQNLRDFTLEKVSVADENATEFQVDNQRRKQFIERRF